MQKPRLRNDSGSGQFIGEFASLQYDYYRIILLQAVYIISDNQYFALGAAALLKHQHASIISPEELLVRTSALEGVCYMFIRCRVMHRQLCRHLKKMACHLIFFLPGNSYCRGARLLSCFWPAMISAKSFHDRSAHVARYFSRSRQEINTPATRTRIHMAAEGMEHYISWVNARSVTPKIAYSHHRALVNTVGIENVSIHTLFLSEYIAASHIALS